MSNRDEEMIIARWLEGSIDEQELRNWLAKDPSRMDLLVEAAAWEADLAEAVRNPPRTISSGRRMPLPAWSFAFGGLVCLLCFGVFVLLTKNYPDSQLPGDHLEIITSKGADYDQRSPSEIRLRSGSALVRKLSTGSATVRCNGITIRDLSTIFHVREKPGGVILNVIDGSVEVTSAEGETTVHAAPEGVDIRVDGSRLPLVNSRPLSETDPELWEVIVEKAGINQTEGQVRYRPIWDTAENQSLAVTILQEELPERAASFSSLLINDRDPENFRYNKKRKIDLPPAVEGKVQWQSYLLVLDLRAPTEPARSTFEGTVEFESKILGLITDRVLLKASNKRLQIKPPGDSWKDFPYVGLEYQPDQLDTVTLSDDRKTLSFKFSTDTIDAIRGLVAAPSD